MQQNSIQQNNNKLVFTHLETNSIRNKFNFLYDQIKGTIYILMTTETKTDAIFRTVNFLIDRFSTPFRLCCM